MALDWWKKLREDADPEPPEGPLDIEVDSDGLTVAEMEHEDVVYQRVLWTDVLMIVAYKKDIFTVDQVRIEVLSASSDEALLMTEDDTGFPAFCQSLATHLPSVEPDWLLQLHAAPAFDETPHVLYRKA